MADGGPQSSARSGDSAENGVRRRSVAVVGAGFGGMGAAALLKQQNLYDFEVFDRSDDVGGVWQANTYPGAACDVPSHLYSFSFAPGHHWSRRFAPQREIYAYIKGLVDQFQLRPHLRLNTEVREARFDESTARWKLTTGDGHVREFDALITACGQLTNPVIPNIPGRREFQGPCFHSARWDHGVDLSGKRVAVIGTGASTAQFVPRIAEIAPHVDIYQRTPAWIIPKPDRAYGEWERWLFRHVPARIRVSRGADFAFFEWLALAFIGNDKVNRFFTRVANLYRNLALKGRPDLIAKTTPDYGLGCKRILLTNEWYRTLRRDNVSLHHGKGLRITQTGVVDADGEAREAEVIIWGTGFSAGDFVAPMKIHGRGGRELADVWAGRPEAYLGITVSGFPNLFVLYGPNTNHGSGSVPFIEECQLNYVLDGLRRLHEGGFRTLELKHESLQRWRQEMEERSRTTIWLAGACTSWYLNDERVNTHNWPGQWKEYQRRTNQLDAADYQIG